MITKFPWRCPKCSHSLVDNSDELKCVRCGRTYKKTDGVFTFLSETNIAESFGIQWNTFPKVQLDSYSGDSRSLERFLNETGWYQNKLKGSLVLDAGCGAGRFSEVSLLMGSHLVMLDASDAIFAARRNLIPNSHSFFVKASLLNLPFKSESFDFVYCIGVLQHTSDAYHCIEELARVTKKGGEIALTFYEKSGWWTLFYSKYLIRPITKRLDKKFLLNIINLSSRIWFPITNILFRLPYRIGKFFQFAVPVANYASYQYSNKRLARLEAVLDTFDMLSPEFDEPLIKGDVVRQLKKSGFEILDSSIKGNVKARKTS